MADLDFDVQLDHQQVDLALSSLERVLAGPFMGTFLRDEAQRYMQTRARLNFHGEHDPTQKKWQALAPMTQERRELDGYGPSHPILRRTGSLEDFITKAPGVIAEGQGMAALTLPGPTGGLMLEKFTAAQKGAKNKHKGWGDVPARPILGIVDIDATMLTLMLKTSVEDHLNQGGAAGSVFTP